MKITVAILALATLACALPCSAQTADTFIKSDPLQCWLDTKDVVHRHATGSIDDETSHSIKVERYTSMQGTLAILVHVSADTDKKKGKVADSMWESSAKAACRKEVIQSMPGGAAGTSDLFIKSPTKSLRYKRNARKK